MSDQPWELWPPHPKDALYPNALRTYSDIEHFLDSVREVQAMAQRDVRAAVANYLRAPSAVTARDAFDTIALYQDALADCDDAHLAWPTALWLHQADAVLHYHQDGDGTLDVTLRRFSDGTV